MRRPQAVRADGLRGHTAGHGTTLIAMMFSGGRAALTHQRLPHVQARQRPVPDPITGDPLIGNLAWDVG